MAIRIFLIDDHEAMRIGLRHLLEPHADLEIVGEASDLRSSTDRIASVAPDVVVLDLRLPDGNGLDLLPHLREACAGAGLGILRND